MAMELAMLLAAETFSAEWLSPVPLNQMLLSQDD